MGEGTKIEWADHTFNPWWGCAKVSPGCAHCYADTFASRYGHSIWGSTAPRRFFGDKHWREPEKWDAAAKKAGERHRVFCASMADVFEDRRDLDEQRVRLLDLIRRTPHLDWLLLTKRPEKITALVDRALDFMMGAWAMVQDNDHDDKTPDLPMLDWFRAWQEKHPPRNGWLGASVEDQPRAVERVDALLSVPARLRFLSVEPLLGPVDLTPWLSAIDWVIVGGESGPGARGCDLAWVRAIVTQCETAGVPCFVKQLGARPLTIGRLRDRKGGDMDEWPVDVRVRQFPEQGDPLAAKVTP